MHIQVTSRYKSKKSFVPDFHHGLLGTEIVNYGTHGLDPLGVSFSLGGTLVNVLAIYLFLPLLETICRRRHTTTATQ